MCLLDYLLHVTEVVGYSDHKIPVVEYHAVGAREVWGGCGVAHLHACFEEIDRTQGDVQFSVEKRFVEGKAIEVTAVSFSLETYAWEEISSVGAQAETVFETLLRSEVQVACPAFIVQPFGIFVG